MVRVPQATFDILSMAAVFEGNKSMQELVSPIVEEAARRFGEEPEIAAALRQKDEYEARKAGRLARVDFDRRGKS